MRKSESVGMRKKPMHPNPRSLGIKARVRKRKKAKVERLQVPVNLVSLTTRKTKPIKASLRLFKRNYGRILRNFVLAVAVKVTTGGGAETKLFPPLPKRLQLRQEREKAEKVLRSRKRLTRRSVQGRQRKNL